MDYTLKELMVVVAAREIRDGERVFVGMRLPLLSFAVAKELHAPKAIGIFENGVIRDWPALEAIFTIDIATLAGRCIIMNHERRRFTPPVHYVTSLGYGDGGDWRERTGLRGGGPSWVITSLGIFTFDPTTREMLLSSYHPGVTVEEIQRETDWPLKLSEDLKETPPPSPEELGAVRKYGPKRVWTS